VTGQRRVTRSLRVNPISRAGNFSTDASDAYRWLAPELSGPVQSPERHTLADAEVMLEKVSYDLRFGARGLRSSPGFALSASLILALGIGSATAVFTIVDGLLLRRLPVSDPDRLVRIWKKDTSRGYDHYPLTYPEYLEWSRRARGFDSIAALWSWSPSDAVITATEEPRRVSLSVVSWNFFDVLGASPLIGRSFQASDETSVAVPPLVLSHAFWRGSLGGDPSVVGQTVRLHYGPVTTFQVIGVLPEAFDLSSGAEAWTPVLAVQREWANGEGCECDLIGRLGPQVSASGARTELQTIHEQLAADAPDRYARMQVVVTPLLDTVVGDAGPVSLLALGAVALLMALAAVNLAGLSLMRAARKRRDLAIRVAMGADGRSLVRQQLAESFLLCLMGLTGGLAVAGLGVQLFLYLKGAELPRVGAIALDWRGVAFSVALLVVTALVFALFPAIRASRVDPMSALKHKGGGGDGRLMSSMVVGEVALAVVLLFGAALLARTLLAQRSIDRGFRSERLLTVNLRLPQSKYPHPESRLAFVETAVEAIERLPGVVAVTPMFLGPGTGWFGMSGAFVFEGQTEAEARANPMANFEWVTPSYFRTLGIPLIRGRTFTPADRLEGERVAIVSLGTAERYWPGQNPIGKTIATGYASHRVVGVVGNTRYRELTRVWQSVYFPLRQNPFSAEARLHELGTPGYLAVRARSEPYALVPAIRSAIRSMDGEVLVDEVATMESLLDKELVAPTFNALLTGFFSVIALLLAATGLFGILATFVTERLPELGVRLALGATPARLQAGVWRRGSVLALAGVLGGSFVALLLSGLIRRFLYGVGPSDPATFAGVIAFVAVAATVAMGVPARRASRADPVSCLRQE